MTKLPHTQYIRKHLKENTQYGFCIIHHILLLVRRGLPAKESMGQPSHFSLGSYR